MHVLLSSSYSIARGADEGRSHRLHSLYIVIFDTRAGSRIVRINIPYPLMRWMGRSGFPYLGQLTFLDDTEFDSEPVRLSINQIELGGPRVIVDARHPGGGQFLAWVE